MTLPMCETAGLGKACWVASNLKADDDSRVDRSALIFVMLAVKV